MKKRVKRRTSRLLALLLTVTLLFSALPVWSAGAVDMPLSAVGDNDIRPLDDDGSQPDTPPAANQQGFAVLADGTYKIVYDNESTALLPESYGGVPVTAIGDNAYMGRDITWAIIPDTVTSIGDYAFADCVQLQEVIIPLSVTSIGEGAFDGCPALRLKIGAGTVAEDYARAHQIPYTIEDISDYHINSVIYNSEDAEVFFFDAQGSRLRLQEGVDYTLDYTYDANRTEATLIVRGKGKYIGEYVEKQQIGGRFPIGNQTLKLSQTSYLYDGTAKTPVVTAYFQCPIPQPLEDDRQPSPFDDEWEEETQPATSAAASAPANEPQCVTHYLKEGRDYTVTYRNNVNTGVAEAVVTGKGFYSGTTTLPFSIIGQTFGSAAVSLSVSSYTYDGTAKTPSVTVKVAGRTLTKDVDYTVGYQNNINAGTATVVVTGMGSYGGSATKTFTIGKRALSGATAVLAGDSFIYDGFAKRPAFILYINGASLTEDVDYSVDYSNNINVGTAAVTATGKGNYTGTVSKYFTIQQAIRAIADCKVTLSQSSYTYDGTAKTPSVTVKDGFSTLKANTDYTVSYSGNTNAGTATVILKGKGNYNGTKSVSFSIQPKGLTSSMVQGESTGYTFVSEQLPYRCTVSNGSKVLTEGTDYTLTCSDSYHAGQATAKVTGKGNYTGTVTRTYTIAPFSIENGAFSMNFHSCEYDGSAKQPKVALVYKSGMWLTKEETEFTVSYQNNVLPGTATVVVTGIGDYTGSISKTFTITPKTTDQFVVELSAYRFEYDGTDKKPTVAVKDGKTTLSEGTHYTVSYSNYRNAGNATVTVTGKGSYSGSKTIGYTITPRHISWATASLSPWSFVYDGTAKTPSLTLTYGNTTLRFGTDYTYSYQNNTVPGTGTVNFTGKGNWTGTGFEEFEITRPASYNAKFQWGTDNWNFNNSSTYFSTKYYINNSILNKFKEYYHLSSTDIDKMKKALNEDNADGGFGGSCYGVTTSEMMAKYGYLDVSRFGGNAVLNKNSASGDIISLVNCFQYSWESPTFNQALRTILFHRSQGTQANMVKYLETHLKNGDKIVNVDFWIKGRYTRAYNGFAKGDIVTVGGHSILAYGVENCTPRTYTETGNVVYDKRILIADPNALTANKVTDDYCIYYRSSDYSWIIPHYTYEPSEHDNKYRQRLCYWTKGAYSDYTQTGFLRYFFDYAGDGRAVNLMDDTQSNRFVSGLRVNSSNDEAATVEQLTESSNTAIAFADSEDTTGVMKYDRSSITDDEVEQQAENFALWNPTASYTLRYDNPAALDVQMDYKDVAYYADLSSSDHVTFSPEGAIEAQGSGTDYSLSMVTNDSECVTDWYKLTVSGGDVNKVQLRKTRGGYFLTADNLQNVTVTANNMEVSAQAAFSANATSVYIYEIDRNTIGVLADMDNNGTFETDLVGDAEFTIGAVGGTGSVSIEDVTMLQEHLAEFRDNEDDPILDLADIKVFSQADVNRDGKVNIKDVTEIQRYLAELIPIL